MRTPTSNTLWIVAAAMVVSGCAADPTKDLERVAKDWSRTIRASQVIPVYPLTEDIQPGDVFLVQTPISKQTEIYEKRGFLPIDQLVTRFHDLDYGKFYEDDYWLGTYATVSHPRPGWTTGSVALVSAPRVAFPTYSFNIKEGGGLQLALPIQGIPVGLGVLGAARANGTVTIKDAYTYAIDGESLARTLYSWYASDPSIKDTLKAMANQADSEVYLRAVNRVYLTKGVIVTLTDQDAVSGGTDVGAAKKIVPPDLSSQDEVEAYKKALAALSEPLNDVTSGPGGSVRFVHASKRSVSLSENFDRPLVIGYAGFDVKVFPETGVLSAPIPSFTVLSGQVEASAFAPAHVWNTSAGELNKAYLAWLNEDNNRRKVSEWLKEVDHPDIDPANLITTKHASLLVRANERFGFYTGSE